MTVISPLIRFENGTSVERRSLEYGAVVVYECQSVLGHRHRRRRRHYGRDVQFPRTYFVPFDFYCFRIDLGKSSTSLAWGLTTAVRTTVNRWSCQGFRKKWKGGRLQHWKMIWLLNHVEAAIRNIEPPTTYFKVKMKMFCRVKLRNLTNHIFDTGTRQQFFNHLDVQCEINGGIKTIFNETVTGRKGTQFWPLDVIIVLKRLCIAFIPRWITL